MILRGLFVMRRIFLHTEICKNLGTDTVIPKIRGKSKMLICLDCVKSLVLKRIGFDFVNQTYSRPS